MYSPEDLVHRGDSDYEHGRRILMFEDIKRRCYSGELVSEHEKEFFLYAKRTEDGEETLLEIPNIESELIRYLTITYFNPERYHLGTNYTKWVRGEIVEVSFQMAEREINWLKDICKSVLDDIELKKSQNTQTEIENEIYKEFRYFRKDLNNSSTVKNFSWFKGSRRYFHELSVIRIGVVYSYNKLLEYLEIWEDLPKTIYINQGVCVISFARILHVFNRHYMAIMKFESDKSFFKTNDILPENLLLEIIETIKSFNQVGFDFNHKYLHVEKNGIMKTMIINLKQGEYHLGSFYPEYDTVELTRIKGYNKKRVNGRELYSEFFTD